jgi:hypothetical protein
MADNAQKTPLAYSLQKFTQSKVLDAIQLLGKALPASVVTVNDWTVEVKFEVNAAPFTLPNVTVPWSGSKYERAPIQVGELGWVRPADARLGAISGLGSGTPTLATPANLSALVWEPLSNTNWDAPPDKTAYLIQGPNGFVLRNLNDDYSIVGNSTSIVLTFGSNSITIDSSGISIQGTLTVNGAAYLSHLHSGVTTGGGDTGPVV